MPKPSETQRRREHAERQLNAALRDHLSHQGLPYTPAVKEAVHFTLGQTEGALVSVLGLLRWAIEHIDDVYDEDAAMLELAKQLTEGVPEAGV